MKTIFKFQSSIGPELLQKLKINEFFLKFPNFRENDSGRGSCLSSYPSGNQVDGLPLVANKILFGKHSLLKVCWGMQ
jgi:hypothetical protein